MRKQTVLFRSKKLNQVNQVNGSCIQTLSISSSQLCSNPTLYFPGNPRPKLLRYAVSNPKFHHHPTQKCVLTTERDTPIFTNLKPPPPHNLPNYTILIIIWFPTSVFLPRCLLVSGKPIPVLPRHSARHPTWHPSRHWSLEQPQCRCDDKAARRKSM